MSAWVKLPFPSFFLLCSLGSVMLHLAAAKLLEAHLGVLCTPALNGVPDRKEPTSYYLWSVMKVVIKLLYLFLIQVL